MTRTCSRLAPVCDVVDEVLLEHEAPLLDDVEQRLFEGSRVDAEPRVEDLIVSEVRHFLVNLLVRIDLFDKRNILAKNHNSSF